MIDWNRVIATVVIFFVYVGCKFDPAIGVAIGVGVIIFQLLEMEDRMQ